MRKGYNYLLISFFSIVIAAFFSKVGALSLDKILFMFISYTLGFTFTSIQYVPKRKKITKETKRRSMNLGIIIGVINFISYFTLLSALSTGPGAIIFPLVGLHSAGIVVFSIIVFEERLNRKGIVGVILAIIAGLLLR